MQNSNTGVQFFPAYKSCCPIDRLHADRYVRCTYGRCLRLLAHHSGISILELQKWNSHQRIFGGRCQFIDSFFVSLFR